MLGKYIIYICIYILGKYNTHTHMLSDTYLEMNALSRCILNFYFECNLGL